MTAPAASSTRATNFAALLATALFWGCNWPIVKILLATNTPWSLRAAGVTGGALVLTAAVRIRGLSLAIPRRHWLTVAIAGVLNVAVFNICVVFAQLTMPTSRAAILTFTMPLWTTLFAWWFLGETIDKRRIAALSIGAAGLAVLSMPFWPVIATGGIPFGLVYVLGAAISWALGTVWLKAHPIDAPALTVTAWQVITAAVVCVACMLAFETPHLDLSQTPQLLAFIYHILLPQGLAYILWFGLVRRIPASTVSLGTLLVPVFGVAGSVLLLGDWPTHLDLAGLGLIVAAVAIDQLRPAPSPQR
jgi:drug/metabolite transporter (DMT)-like permease